ncbi:MAG: hypothetical protein ACTHK7_21930 [Aureliella sp.]
MTAKQPKTDAKRPTLIGHANPTALDKAPAGAYRFAASPMQFDAADETTAGGASVPFTMLARTGDPIAHWFWGRIVHDFAGMRVRDVIPVDYCHNTTDPIGYADSFDTSSGDLVVAGRVESIDAGDEADKLIRKSARKIPYQASIYFDEEALVLEWLDFGFVAQVNGRTVEGPCVIAREWDLRGVAICPHGYDIGSDTELESAAQFSLSWKKGTPVMSTTSTTPASAGELSHGTAPAAPAAPAPAAPAAPPAAVTTPAQVDPRVAFTAELKRYTDQFGEVEGLGYFTAGKPFDVAAAEHIGKLSARLKEAEGKAGEASQKLEAAQLTHGEAAPINTGSTPKEAVTFASLFKPR